jgi:hypothetical protein
MAGDLIRTAGATIPIERNQHVPIHGGIEISSVGAPSTSFAKEFALHRSLS